MPQIYKWGLEETELIKVDKSGHTKRAVFK